MTIDGDDLSLNLQRGNRSIRLAPQFVGTLPNGRMGYFDSIDSPGIGFVGWYPYEIQAWPISQSKLRFKQTCHEIGIDTPAHWLDLHDVTEPFIIKADSSAFGDGLAGPFLPPGDPASGLQRGLRPDTRQLQPGEFAEAFKVGRIARAWYWDSTLAVLEMYPMPVLTGTGRHTFEELLVRQIGLNTPMPGDFAALAAVQGLAPDAVVPAGTSVLADYRYVSPLNPTAHANHNLLAGRSFDASLLNDAGRDAPNRRAALNDRVYGAFARAGQRIAPLLPGRGGHDAPSRRAYVLDAIVDNDDRVWFLEINCNPQLHPDIYPAMLADEMQVEASPLVQPRVDRNAVYATASGAHG